MIRLVTRHRNAILKGTSILIFSFLFFALYSCDDTDEATRRGQTTIMGVVGGPLAKGEFNGGKSILTRIKEFLNFTKTAGAPKYLASTPMTDCGNL